MKKIFLLSVIALICSVQMACADDVVTRDETKLPEAARTFITQHFSDAKISYIKIDSEFLKGKKYEVVLTNGTEIDFNSNGEWKEVDSKRNEIPAALIPAYAKDYIANNFSNQYITKIEKDHKGLEVELTNDLTVKFDKNGNFRKLDD